MKALWLALVILAISACGQLSPAFAFGPPNVPVYPGSNYNIPIVAKIAATGTYTWQAVDSYGWAGWHDIVAEALNTGAADQDSLGNVINRFLASESRGQFLIREVNSNEAPDQQDFAVSTVFLEAKCGDWATACDFLFNNRPVPAYFKAAAMITYSVASNKPIVRHENCHTVCQSCDQYQGGCPRVSDGAWLSTVVCTGNPDTLMDCGGAARTMQRFDYETFKSAYPPSTGFLQHVACGDPCWDGTYWVFSSGDKFKPDAGCGEWYLPDGRLIWGGCDSWGGGARWNAIAALWLSRDGGVWNPANGHYINLGVALAIP